MRLAYSLLGAAIAAALVSDAAPLAAAEANVAVAANFTQVATDIAAAFEQQTGDHVNLSFGATGTLYTQISQGAPFDVLLSADDKRTRSAIKEGFGVAGTEFTYAVGKVVLYSPAIDVTDGAAVLQAGAFQHLAVANPKTAPYGTAAMAALDTLGLATVVAPKIVTGENITQTLQFVASGNAELGFVALSQVIGKPASQVWMVPDTDYPPVRQNAVLLSHGSANQAARDFLDFVRSDTAAALIAAAGYGIE